MRSILVLAGGRTSDAVVFETALAVAKPLQAHLEFLHVCPEPAEAALYTPHVDFARGAGLGAALKEIGAEGRARATAARHHFEALCEKESIDIAVRPDQAAPGRQSASWSEEHHRPVRGILHCARHNDLVVLARRAAANGLPPDLVEQVLIGSGRPVLITPARVPQTIAKTVLVCWKETPEAARALTAAMPVLAVAQRVVLLTVEEEGARTPEAISHLAQRLAWNGIKADAEWLRTSDESVERRIESVALNVGADLLVMGAYGHGRLREFAFGGCTRHFLEQTERPVFMVH